MHTFLKLTALTIWCCLVPVAHAADESVAKQPNVASFPSQQPGKTSSPQIFSSKQTTCGKNIIREPHDVLVDAPGSPENFLCAGRFQLFHEGTNKAIKRYLYAITIDGKLVYTGRGDEKGRTVQFLTHKETTLNLYKDSDAYLLIEQRYPPPKTRLADTFDHIWPGLVLLFLVLLCLVFLYHLLRMLAARRKGSLSCSLCTPKNIRRLFAWSLVALLAAYALQRLVLPFEYDISPPGVVYFYYPQWACGEDCPPYNVADTDSAELQSYIGREARVFERTIDLYHTEEYSRFFKCYGQFKKSVGLYLWEWSSEQVNRKNVTGRYFDAEWCNDQEPTPRQLKMLNQSTGENDGV